MQTLWVKFTDGTKIDLPYNDLGVKLYPTFEEFCDNYRTGWRTRCTDTEAASHWAITDGLEPSEQDWKSTT